MITNNAEAIQFISDLEDALNNLINQLSGLEIEGFALPDWMQAAIVNEMETFSTSCQDVKACANFIVSEKHVPAARLFVGLHPKEDRALQLLAQYRERYSMPHFIGHGDDIHYSPLGGTCADLGAIRANIRWICEAFKWTLPDVQKAQPATREDEMTALIDGCGLVAFPDDVKKRFAKALILMEQNGYIVKATDRKGYNITDGRGHKADVAFISGYALKTLSYDKGKKTIITLLSTPWAELGRSIFHGARLDNALTYNLSLPNDFQAFKKTILDEIDKLG